MLCISNLCPSKIIILVNISGLIKKIIGNLDINLKKEKLSPFDSKIGRGL